jgi:arylformamidase
VKIVDVSISLTPDMPVWPGSSGFSLTWVSRMDRGLSFNNSRMNCDSHIGTHVDAPLHFVENGEPVDQISLEHLIGPCQVAYLPGLKEISDRSLAQLRLPKGTKRLLLRTDNSKLWNRNDKKFKEDFACLNSEATRWIVHNGIVLVGIDYLSIGSPEDGVETHKILLKSQVVVLEGLNLSKVNPGIYELICLPLKLTGAEGAPARVVLRKN